MLRERCLTLGLAQLWIELDGQSVGANGEGAVFAPKEAADGITAFNRSMRSQRTARGFVARNEAPVGTLEGLQGCGIHGVHWERRAHDLKLALGVERGLRVGTHRDDILNFLDVDLFLPDEIAPLQHLLLLDGWFRAENPVIHRRPTGHEALQKSFKGAPRGLDHGVGHPRFSGEALPLRT